MSHSQPANGLALVGVDGSVLQRARTPLVRPTLARRLGPQTEVARSDGVLAHRHDLRLPNLRHGELCLRVELAD